MGRKQEDAESENQVRLSSKRRLVVTLETLMDLVGAVVELLADDRKAQDSFVPVALQGTAADGKQVHDLLAGQPFMGLVWGAVLVDRPLQLVEAVVEGSVSPNHKVARGTGGWCRGVLRRDFRHRIRFGGRLLKERTMGDAALYCNKAIIFHFQLNGRLFATLSDYHRLNSTIRARFFAQ